MEGNGEEGKGRGGKRGREKIQARINKSCLVRRDLLMIQLVAVKTGGIFFFFSFCASKFSSC